MSLFERRRARMGEWLAETGTAAALISLPANVRYLSGFAGEGHLVLTGSKGAVCTDSRYELQAKEEASGLETIINVNGQLASVNEFLNAQGVSLLAFEEHVITYAQFQQLAEQFGSENLKPVQGAVEKLRIVKDAEEIDAIRKAAQITSRSLTELLSELGPGPTEREVALELDRRMVMNGADDVAFDTIVASGPSAACPHASPGQRRLAEGEMVKIDVGCRLNGYCSDMTRTVFLGEPTEQFVELYNVVLDAQEAALEVVRAGLSCAELDGTARAAIEAAGFGEYFTHSLGHGVGLEVHEAPRVSTRSDETLEAGMVVTVEPGIYIEDWGGIRIEDLVVVTEDGCEVLTETPKMRY
jgi:Xaa-Pro aminopeptidase